MLTLFTAPKPFQGRIGVIQMNAIRSWRRLGDDVMVLLIGEEPGLEDAAAALGARHLTGVRRSESGAPSLRSAFDLVRQVSQTPILGYVNADIILLDDFLPAVSEVAQQLRRFLLAGQRWDLDVRDPIAFEPGWQQRMREEITRSGSLHRPVGSDYFVFPADLFPNLPDFTLGRSGWDNWMLFEARHRRIPLIDATRRITAVHQNHDYAHLPGGLPHHRHPESLRNLQLAGGREVIFRLEDADWRLEPQGLVRKRWRDWRYPRRWEADLIARFGPGRLSRWVRMAFRPGRTLRYFLGLRGPMAASEAVPEEIGSQVGVEE